MYKWATPEHLLEPHVLLTRRCIFRDDLAYFSNTKPASLLVLGEIMHISWVTFTCVKAPLMTYNYLSRRVCRRSECVCVSWCVSRLWREGPGEEAGLSKALSLAERIRERGDDRPFPAVVRVKPMRRRLV